jgi:hypothetical protein
MHSLCTVARIGLAGAGLALLGWIGPGLAETTEELETQYARDLTVAQKPVFQLSSMLGNRRIDVDAWVDNPGLTYVVGQPLRIMVRPKQDAYITVVDVGSSGRVSVLYPNHYQRDARVRAGSTLTIPDAQSKWQINVGGPAGVDLIQVIASRQPLSLPELSQLVRATEGNPTISLGRSGDEFARDLVAQLKPQAAGANEAGAGVRNLLVRIVANGPASLPVTPPAAGATIEALMPTLPPAHFGLTIRSERPVYRVGETVRLVASAQHDCRLTLINVGSSGQAVQLFPNTYQRENLVRAGQRVVIPSPQSPVQYVARGPAGVEGIIATCREEGMASPHSAPADGGAGFAPVGTIQAVGKDLIAMLTAPATAPGKVEEASTSYLIVE